MTEAQGAELIALLGECRWFLSMLHQSAVLLAFLGWFWFAWECMRFILTRFSLASSRFGEKV